MNPTATAGSATPAAPVGADEDRWVGVESLYALAAPRLRRHLATLLGTTDDVDDLVQDTLLTAWRAWDRFDGSSTRVTWLLGITTLIVRNHRAKRQRRSSLLARWLHARTPETTTASAAESASHLREVYGMLGEVAPQDREAFLLIQVDGTSTREAAAILGVPPSTAHARASRAAARVRAPHREER